MRKKDSQLAKLHVVTGVNDQKIKCKKTCKHGVVLQIQWHYKKDFVVSAHSEKNI